ncbi:MAG: glycosyltransferase family 4 protein [Limnohabitans sp.]
MTCFFDDRWDGFHGIGRFSNEIAKRIPHKKINISGKPMSPIDPLRLSFLKLKKNDWILSPGYNGPYFNFSSYVITLHDINHIDRSENSGFSKRLYCNLILKNLCRRARAILTVSDFSKRRIVEWSGVIDSKVFNVGNGVSQSFNPSGRHYGIDEDYVFCVSNRRGHKNENGILKAFSFADIPANVKLIFTGEATSDLIALADELGIGNRLIFIGKVSEDDLAALYRGALFLIFPSFYEGFGLPIIEAFASGTPVITSNVTSMPEIAGDAALLVNPIDIEDITAAIARLYHSPALRAELVRRGFTRVKEFSWDAVAERVKAAVKTVDIDTARPLNWS